MSVRLRFVIFAAMIAERDNIFVMTVRAFALVTLLMTLGLWGCANVSGATGNVLKEGRESIPPRAAVYNFTVGVLSALGDRPDEAVKAFSEALRHDPSSPEIAAELASAWVEKGEYEKALAVCEQGLKVNPDSLDLHLIAAGLAMSKRDYPKAEGHYQRALALDPANVNALFYLGTLYGETRRYTEAVAVFKRMLAAEPDHFQGNYYLGKISMEIRDYQEAVKAFRKVLALRPEFEAAVVDLALAYERLGNTAAAIEVFQDYLHAHPDRLNVRVKLAELYMRDRRYEEGERELQKVLRVEGHHRDALMTRAILLLESRRPAEAAGILAKLVGLYPLDFRYRYLSAAACEDLKDFSGAVSHLKAIPPSSELFGPARVRWGTILKKEGKVPEAASVAEQALKEKKDPSLYVFLSSLHEDQKDFPRAEQVLKDGISAFPQGVELYYSLGALYEKTGRFEEGIAQMEKVLAIEPDHADALNFIGYSYADRGIRLDEAERLVAKALALKPGNGYILDSMGWVYFRQNRLKEALTYLRQAAAALPEDGTIAEHLGDALVKAGLVEEAREAYRRALERNPGSETVKKKLDALRQR